MAYHLYLYWLKARQTYYLTVIEVISTKWVSLGLKPKCQYNYIPCRGPRGESNFLSSQVVGLPAFLSLCGHFLHLQSQQLTLTFFDLFNTLVITVGLPG